MNRFRKEERAAHRATRSGLSELEIAQLDHAEAVEAEVADLARVIHAEKFPEEYDHYLDSFVDANERGRGNNPMRSEYVNEVNTKRAGLGLSPLSTNGMPMSDDTWKIAYAQAEAIVKGRSS